MNTKTIKSKLDKIGFNETFGFDPGVKALDHNNDEVTIIKTVPIEKFRMIKKYDNGDMENYINEYGKREGDMISAVKYEDGFTTVFLIDNLTLLD